MHLMVKLTFGALLFLNSIIQIDGFPALLLKRADRNYDHLNVSQRQVYNKDEINKIFISLINHANNDDRLTIYSIVIFTDIIESRLCMKDDQVWVTSDDGVIYNALAKTYPLIQDQYHQLLAKLDEDDQIKFTKLIGQIKSKASIECESIKS